MNTFLLFFLFQEISIWCFVYVNTTKHKWCVLLTFRADGLRILSVSSSSPALPDASVLSAYTAIEPCSGFVSCHVRSGMRYLHLWWICLVSSLEILCIWRTNSLRIQESHIVIKVVLNIYLPYCRIPLQST